ncbi:MAG: methyltransferase type 11 [Desulfuromonadaceae bacterium GWC2_58_13]|nr:MAG: methyltransferase type 11 [Desulfuromonadaceae bacterium GWC2_58_13]
MKTRESGMPEEEMWAEFFTPEAILEKLGLTPGVRSLVDFGCGYGTFALAAARIIAGKVQAIDIEPEMVAATRNKAEAEGLDNVEAILRDFVGEGTDLTDQSVDYVMLFNILHAEDPDHLLKEAFRILRPGGLLAVIHWNFDPTTPRGPSMTIRPKPEQCRAWAEDAGFHLRSPGVIELPPYHYGLVFERPTEWS